MDDDDGGRGEGKTHRNVFTTVVLVLACLSVRAHSFYQDPRYRIFSNHHHKY